MAGARVHEHALERIDADAGDRGHLVVVHVADHPPKDLRRRRVVERIGTERAPLAAHHGGRRRTPAAHIADAEHDRAVGAEDGVVPVAADVDAGATGGVFAGEAQPRRGRKLGRKQALLQAEGDLVLVLEGQRPLERLRGLGGERAEELPFARRETAALGQQADPAGGPAGRVQDRHAVKRLQAAAEREVEVAQRSLALERPAPRALVG